MLKTLRRKAIKQLVEVEVKGGKRLSSTDAMLPNNVPAKPLVQPGQADSQKKEKLDKSESSSTLTDYSMNAMIGCASTAAANAARTNNGRVISPDMTTTATGSTGDGSRSTR